MQRVLLDLCRLMIVVSPEDRSVNRNCSYAKCSNVEHLLETLQNKYFYFYFQSVCFVYTTKFLSDYIRMKTFLPKFIDFFYYLSKDEW